MNTNLSRVSEKISNTINEFWQGRIEANNLQFGANELHDFVMQREAIAPASADRVMRDMRQRGVLNYRLLSRRRSVYEIVVPSVETQNA